MHVMAETDRTLRTAWSPAQFVLLPENRSAVVAVCRLARCVGRRPVVPLLLHGPPGSGKSHLADALLERSARRHSVVRQDAADWAAPEGDVTGEPRECEVLIVEDLQHLPARARDAFAALLDYRVARRRATLLTAGGGPAELPGLPARLMSRLAGGLVVGLEPLATSSRREFLGQLAQWRGLTVRPDALDWLARHTPGSGRQLTAALNRLQNLTASHSQPPDAAAVRTHFEAEPDLNRPTLARITQRVGDLFRVGPKQIRGRARQPGILWPRQVSMYLARSLTDLSLAQVGEYFGRDHSTVRHACGKVEHALTTDAELAGRVRQLRAELAG